MCFRGEVPLSWEVMEPPAPTPRRAASKVSCQAVGARAAIARMKCLMYGFYCFRIYHFFLNAVTQTQASKTGRLPGGEPGAWAKSCLAGGGIVRAATWLGFVLLLSLQVRGAPGSDQEQDWNLLAE